MARGFVEELDLDGAVVVVPDWGGQSGIVAATAEGAGHYWQADAGAEACLVVRDWWERTFRTG